MGSLGGNSWGRDWFGLEVTTLKITGRLQGRVSRGRRLVRVRKNTFPSAMPGGTNTHDN